MASFFKKNIKDEKDPELKRTYMNIGNLMDVPTSRLVEGMKGETILLGGLGHLFSIMGGPNSYKSTMLFYALITAFSRICETGNDSILDILDSEQTATKERLDKLASLHALFKDRSPTDEEIITLTDSVMKNVDEWYANMDNWLTENKIKDKRSAMVDTPFKGKDGKPEKMYFPTFGAIDSLSELVSDSTEKIEDDSTVSGSKGNMLFMRGGLDKQKLIMRLARLCNETDHFVGMSAHVGEKFELATGPMAPKQTKDLPHMKANETAKGAPKKFYFLPTALYQTQRANFFINQGTKGEEFPKYKDKEMLINPDLVKVNVKNIRNKNGSSGWDIDVAVSQTEGVLPHITEFNFLRENDFGLNRSGVGLSQMELKVLPGVKFNRNNLRETCETHPTLKRAINITAELAQLRIFRRDHELVGEFELNELIDDLETKYGWENLLNTRGYWTLNQYTHPKPYLSCVDMVRMHKDQYVPYWWDPKKIQITLPKEDVKEIKEAA